MIKTDKLKLKFSLIKNLKYSNCFIIKIDLLAIDSVFFNPENVICKNGNYIKCEDYKPIPKSVYLKNQSCTGYNVYQKNEFSAINPTIIYKEKSFKIKEKEP